MSTCLTGAAPGDNLMKTLLILALQSILISLVILGAHRLMEIVSGNKSFQFTLRSYTILLLIGFILSLAAKWTGLLQ